MKRSLKRAGALVLGLVFLLALLPGGALAAETVASGDCGDNLTWTLDSDGVLTIEGAGSMYEYFTNTPWASYSSQITQVRVTGGVTSICDYAFYNCRSIVSVQLPAGLTRIGSNAFYMCLALAEITIPDSVTIIGAKAFASTALSRVTVPGGSRPSATAPSPAAAAWRRSPWRRAIPPSAARTASSSTAP